MCQEEKKKRPSNNLLLSLLSTPSTLFDKEPYYIIKLADQLID